MITYEVTGFKRGLIFESVFFLMKLNNKVTSEVEIKGIMLHDLNLGDELTHEEFEQFLKKAL